MKSPPNKNAALIIPALDSPGGQQDLHGTLGVANGEARVYLEGLPLGSTTRPTYEDSSQRPWYSWKQKLVQSNEISWNDEILNAMPDGGDILDNTDTEIRSTAPTGKLLRDMTRDEVQDNWQDVSTVEVT